MFKQGSQLHVLVGMFNNAGYSSSCPSRKEQLKLSAKRKVGSSSIPSYQGTKCRVSKWDRLTDY